MKLDSTAAEFKRKCKAFPHDEKFVGRTRFCGMIYRQMLLTEGKPVKSMNTPKEQQAMMNTLQTAEAVEWYNLYWTLEDWFVSIGLHSQTAVIAVDALRTKYLHITQSIIAAEKLKAAGVIQKDTQEQVIGFPMGLEQFVKAPFPIRLKELYRPACEVFAFNAIVEAIAEAIDLPEIKVYVYDQKSIEDSIQEIRKRIETIKEIIAESQFYNDDEELRQSFLELAEAAFPDAQSDTFMQDTAIKQEKIDWLRSELRDLNLMRKPLGRVLMDVADAWTVGK